ncbi:MAG: hypothetical protein DWQ36_19605 [Acidobacteria bacterium]|nr:MAG: hypothetical protein DWQ30_06035 [Acidobacteriota bacterium]REK03747.1 MAG: hypothetical protein DWQ36_19605 [Acidobacteriota bacterium]
MAARDLHDELMEAAVLGAAFVSTDLAWRVVEETQPSDYWSEKHRQVWLAIERSLKETKGADLRTVTAALEDAGYPNMLPYVATLDVELPDLSRVGEYVREVRELAARRRLRSFVDTFRGMVEDGEVALDEVVARTTRTVAELVGTDPAEGFATSGDLAAQVREAADRTGERTWGVRTGYEGLDRLTRGFRPGQLVVLAGRPGMGKTALALGMALGAARDRQRVAVFSYEMTTEELALRVAAQVSNLPFARIRDGGMPPDDVRELAAAAHEMQGLSLYTCDHAMLSTERLHAMCRQLQRGAGLDFVVVDYLQLVTPTNKRAKKVEQITDISRDLKLLALDLKVPVLALSQLNRSLEDRPNKRPRLSDLRESGAIEQDADLVLFVFRECLYDPDAPKALAELEVAKHRNGELRRLALAFDPPSMTFAELTCDEALVA